MQNTDTLTEFCLFKGYHIKFTDNHLTPHRIGLFTSAKGRRKTDFSTFESCFINNV
jgi:hypothetical protein